ncbi:MAG: exodeoxyribonuclease VII large subunit [Deltaproteobacteria bacterium]|nr:exodeoxyribonuclease VII large subunit [Deltaproteobacteria bacterium]
MREILTVSLLNARIKESLEDAFPFVWVEGEISNLRRPSSGHIYFTLKDENSQIRAVVFRSALMQGPSLGYGAARFAIEEGMSIRCRARLSVYEPRGEYQLIVDVVEPVGLGALQKAFEQLKARLQAEGLFDDDRKKPIPCLPGRIGVVTSPTGSVIRDILQVTARRFPSVNILIAPVRVQGTLAAGEIVSALDQMQKVGGIDVIILARGGGSLEDLAPFNDESVARAIHRSRIPVISAIGHETDYTIADFVADLRAPTPSAAAELAVPNREDLGAKLATLKGRLLSLLQATMTGLRERIALCERRLVHPKRRIADIRLGLDDRTERLKTVLANRRENARMRLTNHRIRLLQQRPTIRVRQERLRLDGLEKNLSSALQTILERARERLGTCTAVLDTLSPLAVLKRGYSITRRLPEGYIIRKAAEISAGTLVEIKVSEGGLRARVTDTYGE